MVPGPAISSRPAHMRTRAKRGLGAFAQTISRANPARQDRRGHSAQTDSIAARSNPRFTERWEEAAATRTNPSPRQQASTERTRAVPARGAHQRLQQRHERTRASPDQSGETNPGRPTHNVHKRAAPLHVRTQGPARSPTRDLSRAP